MGNKIIKIAIIIIVMAIIIFITYAAITENEAKESEDKQQEEISYLDTKLLSLINYLNNIDLQNYRITVSKIEESSDENSNITGEEQEAEQKSEEETVLTEDEEEITVSTEEEPDWETIQGELQVLYSTWPTIILDLYKINVDSDDILKFSGKLDDTIISIKEKDKVSSAIYLASLYSYLPSFMENTRS